MKTEKRQFGNRMGAAVLLLALVCANGYAQEENKSSNNNGASYRESCSFYDRCLDCGVDGKENKK